MDLLLAALLFVFGFIAAGYSDHSPLIGTLALVLFAACALVFIYSVCRLFKSLL
jgi:VIT1/CCC1 family predicted Fe2+/Mn2+ transporter